MPQEGQPEPIPRPLVEVSTTIGLPDREPSTGAEKRIGPYRLLQVVGEGGFGTVYLAEQTVPMRRRVALKVIKLGMDSRQVIARFEAERQALAMMDHPHVARVFDAGLAEDGRPYFVMEYVHGVPITEHCDRQRSSVAERLELFVQVCEAVQHAHQKGIIHRDIKPSNILVEYIDDRPTPKVIDFGVSKALNQQLTEKTLFTELGQLIGTPEYMSPEQAEMNAQDIDTRSDIYSLGVLLYELLTGTLPFDSETLRRAGFAAIQRMIREVEPQRPSTRLSSLGAQSAGVAERRHADVRSLTRTLRGDLDWIVMKCMEKDRSRRYDGAGALSMEIRRHLKNEPVLAGPPGVAYRIRKYLKRNRLQVAVGLVTAICLLLAVLLSSSTFLIVRENRLRGMAEEQRDIASRERDRAEALLRFMQDMIASSPQRKGSGRDALVVDQLETAIKNVDTEFTSQPELAASLQATIGHAYLNLAMYTDAQPPLERALQTRRALSMNDSLELAQCLNDLGAVYFYQRQLDKAETLCREGLAMRTRLFGSEHREIATSLILLAACQSQKGDHASAETMYRRAWDMRKSLLLSPTHLNDPDVAAAMGNLSICLKSMGADRLPEAEQLARDAVTMVKSIDPLPEMEVAAALGSLASVLAIKQDPASLSEAIMRSEESLEIKRSVYGDNNPSVALTLNSLADMYVRNGDLEKAKPLYQESLNIRRSKLREMHPETAVPAMKLGEVLVRQKQYAQAEPLFREAIKIRETEKDKFLPESHMALARCLTLMATEPKFAEAERLLLNAHDTLLKQVGSNSNRTKAAASRLVDLYTAWGKPEKAAAFKGEAREAVSSRPATP